MRTGHLKPSDVLINKDGAQTGKVARYRSEFPEAVINEHLFLLRGTSAIRQDYLFRIVQSDDTQRTIRSHITGSAQPGLNRSFLKSTWVPLPPLEEQRRIAVILDSIDETIQATEHVIAKRRMILTGLQESLLKEDSCASRTTIGDLVSHHWPGEWGNAAPSHGFQEAIVLRSTNLDDYGVDYSTGARRFVVGPKVADKRLRDGDLLVEAAGGGPGVPVGRVRRFQQPAGDTSFLTSNFFRTLRPKAGVDPDYLFWLLDREYRKPSIWSCQQQTTGIINLKVALRGWWGRGGSVVWRVECVRRSGRGRGCGSCRRWCSRSLGV